MNEEKLMLSVSIQAGGESRRMGQNKALMSFLGRPMIQRVIERVAVIASEISIITNGPLAYEFLNLPTIADRIPGQGVLGGLYTSLLGSGQPFVASIACDMPFVSPDLLKIEYTLLLADAADVVVPESANGLEPLHAVYRRETCLPFVKQAIDHGERRLISWFHQVNVRILSRAEVAAVDPDGLAFLNINTPEDFTHSEAIALGQNRADTLHS